MRADVVEDATGEPGPGLAIGAGVRGNLNAVAQRPPGMHFTKRLAAGRVWRKHLSQKRPESDQRAKEPQAAADAGFFARQERIGDHGAESGAQLRERLCVGLLRAQFCAKGARGAAKKKGAEGGEEGSVGAHYYAYIDV